jgi:hypothetical protein
VIPPATAPSPDPEQKSPTLREELHYSTQMRQLWDMGFRFRAENFAALKATHGNVEEAVERLSRR